MSSYGNLKPFLARRLVQRLLEARAEYSAYAKNAIT
jgi:hypothetical protein